MPRDVFHKTLAFVILAVLGVAFSYLTYLDFTDLEGRDLPNSEIIVLARFSGPPGPPQWTISEVLRGHTSGRTLSLARLPRLLNNSSTSPEGVVCYFEPRYYWFGPLILRRVDRIRDGRVGSAGLTLDQVRQHTSTP